jgi:hypothetical protein
MRIIEDRHAGKYTTGYSLDGPQTDDLAIKNGDCP